MSINLRSLQNRNFFLFMFALIVTVSAVLAVTLQQTFDHSTQQLNGQFQVSRSVLAYKLEKDVLALNRGLRSASKDFNVKQLIHGAKDDSASLLAAINNYQTRWRSDFVGVFDQDNQLIVATTELNGAVQLNHFSQDKNLNFVSFDGSVFLVARQPVKFVENVPKPDAYLLTGINLNRLISSDLDEITNFEVSVRYNEKVVASSYQNLTAEELTTTFSSIGSVAHPKSEQHSLTSPIGELISYHSVLGLNKNRPVEVFYTLPESKAHLNYENLIVQLSYAIAVITLLISFLTFSFSKSISKPLRALADVANKIRHGEYPEIEHDKSLYEVETLSFALSDMQDAIEKREKENHQLAFYNNLTGLPNRTYFLQTLNQHIQQSPDQAFAVLWMDIDRFKDFNDTLGHEFGDKVIAAIGQRLKENITINTFLAYLEGDEYALLMPLKQSSDTEVVAGQIAHLFDKPFIVDDIALDVSSSIGVATYPKDATKVEQLMQFADIALYQAKTQHFSVSLYQPSDNKYSVVRLSLMTELKNAIEQQQLKLHYQPKIDIKTGKVHSVECLVRWEHPEHGFIFPDDFIPLAEQTGNIRHLTHWAIEQALLEHKVLQKHGFDVRMAVNISAIDLIDLDLPPFVARLLASYQLSADMLTLEVTESAIMADPDNAITALYMLKNMGIKLSIDDFGTGYSSMEQLKRTPVDELKIDKSFVLDLANNKDDMIIVKSITNLAHNLGMSIVAEGVEDLSSLTSLNQLNVETAQGYYISKPLDEMKLLEWLQNNNGNVAIET